ncbi:hypothetical protein ACEQPO_28070 [Bacillus sp. SL00103]
MLLYGGFLRGMGHVVRMKRLARLIQKETTCIFYTNEQVCVEMLAFSVACSFGEGIKCNPSDKSRDA